MFLVIFCDRLSTDIKSIKNEVDIFSFLEFLLHWWGWLHIFLDPTIDFYVPKSRLNLRHDIESILHGRHIKLSTNSPLQRGFQSIIFWQTNKKTVLCTVWFADIFSKYLLQLVGKFPWRMLVTKKNLIIKF